MDLAAPRSIEDAREIQRRGQLKFGYFTNFIRLRIEYTVLSLSVDKATILIYQTTKNSLEKRIRMA